MRGNIWRVFALIAIVALPVLGQTPAAQTSPAAISKPSPVSRLPYMAEFKILRTKPLPNGTAVTRESTVITARDSQGRHMTATTAIPTSADETATTHFHVFDPVAHVIFNWSFPGREATVMAIPFSGMFLSGCSVMGAGIASANAKNTVEDLGTTSIMGVDARGSRTTTTEEELIRKHNKHKPQARTIEVSFAEFWKATAPGLAGLVVREVTENAQSGKSSKELVNFRQAEPDAAVFRPPIGYVIANREVNADPCLILWEMEPPATAGPLLP
ncbi:MAG: hypothetical protein ABSD72_11735 [Terracidiphilus sp.]|jgi:hypothetical protein